MLPGKGIAFEPSSTPAAPPLASPLPTVSSQEVEKQPQDVVPLRTWRQSHSPDSEPLTVTSEGVQELFLSPQHVRAWAIGCFSGKYHLGLEKQGSFFISPPFQLLLGQRKKRALETDETIR